MNKGMVFIGVGFELVAVVLAGIYVGQAIDKWFGSNGIATMLLMLLMLAGWFVHLFVLLKKFDDDSKAPKP
jgi:F0F1-type ATP synthase assembly protein I